MSHFKKIIKSIPPLIWLYRAFYWNIIFPICPKDDWKYLYHAFTGNSRGKKGYILWSVERSGSQLLGFMLAQHPNITYDAEFFANKEVYKWKRLISRGLLALSETSVYGYKLFPSHFNALSMQKQRAFFKTMVKKGWKIIYLKRLNIWHQVISLAKAKKLKFWYDVIPEYQKPNFKKPDTTNLTLSSREILDCFESCLKFNEQLEFAIQGLPYLSIQYEQDLLDPNKHQRTIERVFEYLDVESAPVKAIFNKQSSEDLRSDIANYDEIISIVKQSKYAKYL